MADAQLLYGRQVGDRPGVAVVQTVTGVDAQPGLLRQFRRLLDQVELLLHLHLGPGLAVAAGVQFDKGRARVQGRLDLGGVRVDEDRHRNARLAQLVDRLGHLLGVLHHVQPALGGQLLALLRHQGDQVRDDLQGEVDDLRRDRHLQVELGLDRLPQQAHVPVLDVPPVLAQMDNDPLGAGQFADAGRLHRVRLDAAARLAKGGHMVDIDGQIGHVRSPCSMQPLLKLLFKIPHAQRLVLGALVVVANQMQEAVDDQAGEPVVQADPLGHGLAPGGVHRNEDVAQLGLGQHCARLAFHRKGEDVGRPLFLAVLLVVGGHLGIVEKDHAHLSRVQAQQAEQPVAVLLEHGQVEMVRPGRFAWVQAGGHVQPSRPVFAGARRPLPCCS